MKTISSGARRDVWVRVGLVLVDAVDVHADVHRNVHSPGHRLDHAAWPLFGPPEGQSGQGRRSRGVRRVERRALTARGLPVDTMEKAGPSGPAWKPPVPSDSLDVAHTLVR